MKKRDCGIKVRWWCPSNDLVMWRNEGKKYELENKRWKRER